jgi:pyruvate/2-oxoglutarate dehydrogenase complex dihydrolipoamide dehydrogenase (E3) component
MQKFGFRVLLIDKTDHAIGGECLNDGCVPSKALIHVARQVHQARQATAFGLQVSGAVDLAQVMAYVKNRQDEIRDHENATYFRQEGMDVALGTARFTGKKPGSRRWKVYHGKKIVIATGSRPRRLEIPGVEGVRYLTNQNLFHLEEVPGKLLVVGGGPLGIEMAQAFRRLGSEVTVVHSKAMILENEAPEIASVLSERLRAEGIRFHLESEAHAFPDPHHLVIKRRTASKLPCPSTRCWWALAGNSTTRTGPGKGGNRHPKARPGRSMSTWRPPTRRVRVR